MDASRKPPNTKVHCAGPTGLDGGGSRVEIFFSGVEKRYRFSAFDAAPTSNRSRRTSTVHLCIGRLSTGVHSGTLSSNASTLRHFKSSKLSHFYYLDIAKIEDIKYGLLSSTNIFFLEVHVVRLVSTFTFYTS